MLPLSSMYFWLLNKKFRYLLMCWLSPQFYSLDQYVSFVSSPCCFYYHTTLQSEIGNGDTSNSYFIMQKYFSYPRWFVFSFEAKSHSLKFCEKLCWNFNGVCIESVDWFWEDEHFHNIDPTSPWTWEICPSSDIFCLFQCLKVFIIQVFHLHD